MATTADQLPDDLAALKAMVLAREVENQRLRQIIKELQRHRFGRRAETLPEDQLLLGLEEAEQIEAAGEEAQERSASEGQKARTARRRTNRGSLPAHLPRVEMVVDIEDRACPCCRSNLHRIGEDVSERLDIPSSVYADLQQALVVSRKSQDSQQSKKKGGARSPAPEFEPPAGTRTTSAPGTVR